MFGIVEGKKLIAIHDDKDVIESYHETLEEDYNIETEIVKLDRKKVENSIGYSNLYLVRYGDSYIPSKLFTTAKSMDDQAGYDLKYAHDILMRLLEYSTDTKDKKHLIKSLLIIQREMENTNISVNPKTIEAIRQMDETFKDRHRLDK